jgi:hypothetical protein
VVMALLKPDFIRAHPIQAGMFWAVGFAILFPLIMWLMGSPIPLKVEFFGICLLGGLMWGYSMKLWHDWKASRP